jgi:outer membrane lipoprotein-sorting protein
MTRLPLTLIGALGAAFTLAWPAIAGTITPDKILQAQDDLPYTGLLLINGTQKVQVTHGAGEQARQAFLDAKGQLSDLVISDGHIRWHYAPRMRMVRLMPVDPEVGRSQRLSLLGKNYRFQVMGQAKKAGRLVILTRFTPKNEGNMTHMLWVDPTTYLPLAVERRSSDGSLIDRSEYLKINYRPKLAAKAFEFAIPDGCQVAPGVTTMAHGDSALAPPQNVGFRPPLPRVMPKGYALLSWKYFTAQKQVPTFNWRFHDGLNSISLFAVEERHQPGPPPDAKVIDLGRKPAFMIAHGANHMLMWKADGIGYTLVGHVPDDDMLQVAKSTL